jgi:CBS domain-containing protein
MLKDIVNRKLVTTEPSAKISEVAQQMAHFDVGCVLVVENKKIKGLITDRDIVLRCIAKDVSLTDCVASSIMTETPATVRDTDGIFDCIETMRGAKVRRIPVVDRAGDVVGIVSFGDILAVLSKELAELTKGTVPQVSSSEFAREAA